MLSAFPVRGFRPSRAARRRVSKLPNPDTVTEDPGPFDINSDFIGGACNNDNECPFTNGFCLTDAEGWPNGMCTQACTLTCPDQAGAAVTFCIDGADFVIRMHADGGEQIVMAFGQGQHFGKFFQRHADTHGMADAGLLHIGEDFRCTDGQVGEIQVTVGIDKVLHEKTLALKRESANLRQLIRFDAGKREDRKLGARKTRNTHGRAAPIKYRA